MEEFGVAILTAARTNEGIGARWVAFDLQEKLCTIPAERMKWHRQHRVALSTAVVKLLKSIRPKHHEDAACSQETVANEEKGVILRRAIARTKRGDLLAEPVLIFCQRVLRPAT